MPNPKLEELEEEKRREQPKAPPHHKGGLLGKYTNVEIFAYALTAISAFAATWSSIGRMFADSIESMEWVQALKNKRNSKIDQLYAGLKNTTPSILQERKAAQKLFKKQWEEIRKEYKAEYSRELKEKMGIHNTFDKWMELPRHQKITTFMGLAGIISIVGVVIYTINKERIARNKLEEEREKRVEAQEQIKIHEKQHQQQEMATEEKAGKTPPIVMGDKTKALLESREALPSDMAFPTL